jgi:uncharacterized membrane protein
MSITLTSVSLKIETLVPWKNMMIFITCKKTQIKLACFTIIDLFLIIITVSEYHSTAQFMYFIFIEDSIYISGKK